MAQPNSPSDPLALKKARDLLNRPGVSQGNWAWRYTPDQLEPAAAERLLGLTRLYGRLPHPV